MTKHRRPRPEKNERSERQPPIIYSFWTASGQIYGQIMQKHTTLLIELYRELYGSTITIANLNELASDLSQIVRRSRPWTGKFLHSLIKEYPGFTANGQLVEALTVLAGRQDGVDEVQARSKEAKVLTVNRLPAGTVVLGQAQRCATPGCQILFVPTHPRQKYHSKACAEKCRRKKRTKIRPNMA